MRDALSVAVVARRLSTAGFWCVDEWLGAEGCGWGDDDLRQHRAFAINRERKIEGNSRHFGLKYHHRARERAMAEVCACDYAKTESA